MNITYAGNSLSTANILVEQIDHENLPQIDAKTYALSHTSKSVVPYLSYPNRTVIISGKVIGSSITDLDTQLDTFRSYLIGIDQNLDIDYKSGTRRYVATVNEVKITRPGNLLYANFVITLFCTQPFGQDTSTTTAWSQTGITASSANHAHTFVGTAPEQKLVTVTITINSVSDSGGGHIVFGNNSTGEQLTVQDTFANGDVVVIDCANKIVTVNGVEVDPSGAFPLFASGSQTLTYLDNFTSRNVNISAVYYPLYL